MYHGLVITEIRAVSCLSCCTVLCLVCFLTKCFTFLLASTLDAHFDFWCEGGYTVADVSRCLMPVTATLSSLVCHAAAAVVISVFPLATSWSLPPEFCYCQALLSRSYRVWHWGVPHTHSLTHAVSLSLCSRSWNFRNVSNLQHSTGTAHGRMLVYSVSEQLRKLLIMLYILVTWLLYELNMAFEE